MSTQDRTVELTVVRQEPGGEPHRETVSAPVTPTSTVLDLLEWAKAGPWPTLAFRYSCRSGVCGSCGVMVNGRPVLACETNAFGYLTSGVTVGPLARIPVHRDLITDVDGFLARMRKSLTWLVPGDSASEADGASAQNDGMGANGASAQNDGEVNRQTSAELARYRLLAECLNCLLCYAACPVFPSIVPDAAAKPTAETDPEFYGPAAIALAQRWNLDSRDAGKDLRDEAIGENEHGIWPCTQDGSCTRVCPQGLDPKAVIGQLQKQFLS